MEYNLHIYLQKLLLFVDINVKECQSKGPLAYHFMILHYCPSPVEGISCTNLSCSHFILTWLLRYDFLLYLFSFIKTIELVQDHFYLRCSITTFFLAVLLDILVEQWFVFFYLGLTGMDCHTFAIPPLSSMFLSIYTLGVVLFSYCHHRYRFHHYSIPVDYKHYKIND